MSINSENIVDIRSYNDSTDPILKAKYSVLYDNLKTMSTQDILQQVFELTFPNLNYQPMSKDFVNNKKIYSDGLLQFMRNLTKLRLVIISHKNRYGYYFKYILTIFSISLDDLGDFLQLNCPSDILLYVNVIDDIHLEISHLLKDDTDVDVEQKKGACNFFKSLFGWNSSNKQ